MMKDNHVAGEGNAYYTLFREYDPDLGRWWRPDPIFQPWQSPYPAFDGNPIMLTDVWGLVSKVIQEGATSVTKDTDDNGNTTIYVTADRIKNQTESERLAALIAYDMNEARLFWSGYGLPEIQPSQDVYRAVAVAKEAFYNPTISRKKNRSFAADATNQQSGNRTTNSKLENYAASLFEGAMLFAIAPINDLIVTGQYLAKYVGHPFSKNIYSARGIISEDQARLTTGIFLTTSAFSSGIGLGFAPAAEMSFIDGAAVTGNSRGIQIGFDKSIFTTSSVKMNPCIVYTISDESGGLFKFGVSDAGLDRLKRVLKESGSSMTPKISNVMPKYEAHIIEKYMRSLHYNSTGVWRLRGMTYPYPRDFETGTIIKP